jgi:phenylalanyl-tRNA synthetase beta chain
LEVGGVRLYGVKPPEGMPVKAEDAGPYWDPEKIVIGEVLAVERHPDADRLTMPTVSFGGGRTKQLVTGAPNIKVGDKGQKVVVALTGSVLYDGHAKEKTLKELKPTKIRGVPSDSMVCSQYELGISEEHEGIIILDDDAPVGMPLVEYMGDVVLDLDVLPNMARCLSLLGVAREVAALTGQAVRLPPHAVQATGEPIAGKVAVAIEDPMLCARFTATLLKDARIGSSPGWMRRRLTYAGMRPISNVVDVTNYVMLEWGQPLHAFDYDKLVERAGGRAPTIIVRPARAGETLVTLDKQKRELTPDHLLITDERGPIALAGVMGGLETEVGDATTNILLESANFNFVSIRRTVRAFDLPSEASSRFSKGLHPELAKPGAARAAELMRLHAGATVCQGVAEAYPAPRPPQVIDLDLAEVRRILGTDVPADDATRVLRALEFQVEADGPGKLRVTAPPNRTDIQEGPADLIEELARIHGYDRLSATLLADQLPEQHGNRSLELEERVRDLLVDAGLQEVITYALTLPEREAPLGLSDGEYVRLLNPISSERVALRHTVLAGVLDVAAANLRHAGDVRVFEIGSTFHPKAGDRLPDEPRRLALVLTGSRRPEFWGGPAAREALEFFDLKGIVEMLAEELRLPDVAYRPSKANYLHPARSAELLVKGTPVGAFGELHPRVAEAYALGGRTILAGELDLETLLAAVPERYAYRPVPRFPAALRDVAVIIDEGVTAERVAAEVRAAGGDLLRDVRLFDVYRGDSIPPGTKSLAYALTYQADDRTLTDKEMDKAHKKVEDRLKHVLKAQVRGKDPVK